ncbi:type II toxin-antitoxin system HicA family toxin [Halorientalis halophila]|uniref:type II toxin-antitoxin system HicA family toxin n=1 Tax=Halorientalis halophila TaxID=3108499 RepID=UPI003AB916BE
MTRRTFTGREVAKAITEMGFAPVDRTGSHLKLRYVHPETGDVRNVTVPIHGEIETGTLRSIAEQCGADDFDSWCVWIEDLL